MNDLSVEFKNIFNKIPAIIYIYNFEALDLASQNENALKVLDEALNIYPNSIPLKVYKYQKTKDENLKKDLIENNSNHWMVKQVEIKNIN